MTVEEAVGLVLEAARMADSGEIFVLDMGEPVRMLDLVTNYAEQLHADADVRVRYTGLRPGEKLNETLFGRGEERAPTEHPRISVDPVRGRPAPSCSPLLRYLYESAQANEPTQVAGCSARCCRSTRAGGGGSRAGVGAVRAVPGRLLMRRARPPLPRSERSWR